MRGVWALFGVVPALAGVAPTAPAAETTPSQTQATVPPALQALEQQMGQIHFNTARISERFVFGELGSPAGGAELGSGVNKAKSLVIAAIGAIRLSPPAAMFVGGVEWLELPPGHSLAAGKTEVRTIGKTTYTYEPSVASFDGGRPWIRRRQKPSPKPRSRAVQLSAVFDSLAPTFADSAPDGSGGPFAKLIEDLNGAVAIREDGLVTVDGQQTTEFTASLSLVQLLAGELSPKQLAAIKRKPDEATVELEVFIAPNGLPVRTTGVLGGRLEGIGTEQDILALEVPVVVRAPPANRTIGDARLRKLEKRHFKKLERRRSGTGSRKRRA